MSNWPEIGGPEWRKEWKEHGFQVLLSFVALAILWGGMWWLFNKS